MQYPLHLGGITHRFSGTLLYSQRRVGLREPASVAPHHSGPAPYHNTCVEVYFRRYIDGRMYAAIWPYYKVTRTEALDKQGNVVRLATPEMTKEQRLFSVRDDGVMFGDDGSMSFAVLGL